MGTSIEEIKNILKEVALLQKQNEAERKNMQERDVEMRKSIAEMREAIAEDRKSIAEVRESIRDEQKSMAEMRESANKIWERIEAMQTRTDRQIAQVNKQIGEIGNKWGTFTEGLSIASIEKIVKQLFKVTHFSPNAERTVDSEHIEIDALGIANGEIDVAVLVEVKSHLRREDLQQLTKIIHKFPKMYPEYRHKKLYAIMACVYAPKNLRQELRKQGIYLVMPQDNILQVIPFEAFTPKNFNTSQAKSQ